MRLIANLHPTFRSWSRPPRVQSATVLLAVADGALRRKLASRLDLEGHYVIEVDNGLGFLAELDELLGDGGTTHRSSVFIVDETMPGRSSLVDMARHMAEPPALICTLGGIDVSPSIHRCGVVQHFKSPVDTERLMVACNRAGTRTPLVRYPFGDVESDYPVANEDFA